MAASAACTFLGSRIGVRPRAVRRHPAPARAASAPLASADGSFGARSDAGAGPDGTLNRLVGGMTGDLADMISPGKHSRVAMDKGVFVMLPVVETVLFCCVQVSIHTLLMIMAVESCGRKNEGLIGLSTM